MKNRKAPFVGRKKTLKRLQQLSNRPYANLIVITGRRRIGKSRLIAEFAKSHNLISITGLPPTAETTAQSQRNEFSRQLAEATHSPELQGTDWGALFSWLGTLTQDKPYIIALDEISWMGSKDPDFLGKLKIAWDQYFEKNPNLMLILCGSVSSWINQNILSSTAFFGRIALKIHLKGLSLPSCYQLLKALSFSGSNYEALQWLTITGPIPWYISLLNPAISIKENIKRICFEEDGILHNEYDHIFHDLFNKRDSLYKKITETLANGPQTLKAISEKINYQFSGTLINYIDNLIEAGFLSRDFTWSLESNKKSKLSRIRLSDNYLRFYLKYIQNKEVNYTEATNFNSIMGLQFENLIINNKKLIYQELGISESDIINAGPFFQTKTTRRKGCQIDLLIQTKQKTLYACEIKFSQNTIGMQVAHEVKEKLSRLTLSRGLACIPVLIHISGVTTELLEAKYFNSIVDLNDLLIKDERIE